MKAKGRLLQSGILVSQFVAAKWLFLAQPWHFNAERALSGDITVDCELVAKGQKAAVGNCARVGELTVAYQAEITN